MKRSEVIRSLRAIREAHEQAIGRLLAELEAESGKKGEPRDGEIEDDDGE